MIFVDTSIWIRAFRSRRSLEAKHLSQLLDQDDAALAIVTRLEILIGASPRNREDVRVGVSALPVYRPDDATWTRVEAWADAASLVGQRFGVADLLIAAIAAGRNAELWSADEDFVRMARLGFVRLHTPTADA